MTERSLVWVLVDKGRKRKKRPGIVLKQGDVVALVAFGTGTKRDRPHVPLEMGTRVWRALSPPLTKPTYFYPGNVAVFVASQAEDSGKKCPPDFFIELWRMVEQHTRFPH